MQLGLAWLGFDVGVVDGVFGRRTRSRISDYQRKKEIPETGYLNAELRDALVAFGAARKADDEASSRARRSGTVEGLEEYLSSHPDGRHGEEIRALLAEASKPKWPEGKKFRDCAECPELVVVPSGSFDMGSPSWEKGRSDDEGPVHRVTFEEPFAAGVYEVTFREWDACHRAGGCSHDPGDRGWGRGDRPVINVSWSDAKEYVRWLSGRTGEEYRLLSESEWEHAARAGTTGPFHFGTTISPDQANYDGRYTYGTGRKGRYRERTVPVGSFSPNAFGLHDVHGNVREWVEDCWHGSYREHVWTEVRGRVVEIAAPVCCVAARGATLRGSCVPRIASGTPPGSGTTMSVFAYPGRWIESCLFASSPLVRGSRGRSPLAGFPALVFPIRWGLRTAAGGAMV